MIFDIDNTVLANFDSEVDLLTEQMKAWVDSLDEDEASTEEIMQIIDNEYYSFIGRASNEVAQALKIAARNNAHALIRDNPTFANKLNSVTAERKAFFQQW